MNKQRVLSAFFIMVSIAKLFAEPSAQEVRAYLHETFDPPAILVWNEGGKAVEAASKVVVRAVSDSSSWILDNRENIARTVVVTINRTVDEARDLWDAYGATVGNTLLILGDAAIEGAEGLYVYSRELACDVVLYYDRNNDRIREDLESAMEAAKPYLDTAVVYAVDAATLAKDAAIDAVIRGEAYYREHEDEIMAGFEQAYIWSSERLEEISEIAKDEWLPTGKQMIAKAVDYYSTNIAPEVEEKTRFILKAASDAADELLQKGEELTREYQHLPEGFALYLADSGASILKYASEKGSAGLSELVEKSGPVRERLAELTSETARRGVSEAVERIRSSGIVESSAKAASGIAQESVKAAEKGAKALSAGLSETLSKATSSGIEQASRTVQSGFNQAQKSASDAASSFSRSAGDAIKSFSSSAGSALGLFGGKR